MAQYCGIWICVALLSAVVVYGNTAERRLASPSSVGERSPHNKSSRSIHMHVHRYRSEGVDTGAGLYGNMATNLTRVLPASLVSHLALCDPSVLQPPPNIYRRKEGVGEAQKSRRKAQQQRQLWGGRAAKNEEPEVEGVKKKQKEGSAVERGAWYLDDAGHWAFEPAGCKLWRPSASEALGCVAGKRIIMMGDSVTRYQYTSLAYFLTAGHYQDPYDVFNQSVSNYHKWNSYPKFYSGVPDLLQQVSHKAARMTCNCSYQSSHVLSGELHPAAASTHQPSAATTAYASPKPASSRKARGGRGPGKKGQRRRWRAAQRRLKHAALWRQKQQALLEEASEVVGGGGAQREVLEDVGGQGSQAGVKGSSRSKRARPPPQRATAPVADDKFEIWHLVLPADFTPGGQVASDSGHGQQAQQQARGSTAGGGGGASTPAHRSTQLDFFYIYKHPTFLAAVLEAVAWAFSEPPPVHITHHHLDAPAPTDREDEEELDEGEEGEGGPSTEGRQYWGTPHKWRPPDVLVMNAGIFWPQSTDYEQGVGLEGVMRAVFKYTRKLADKYGTRVVWKTVSAGSFDNTLITPLALEAGFEVLDVHAIAQAAESQGLLVRWDRHTVHFMQVGYEQFNDLMLSQLCPWHQ